MVPICDPELLMVIVGVLLMHISFLKEITYLPSLNPWSGLWAYTCGMLFWCYFPSLSALPGADSQPYLTCPSKTLAPGP
jgi:hypothetical protein